MTHCLFGLELESIWFSLHSRLSLLIWSEKGGSQLAASLLQLWGYMKLSAIGKLAGPSCEMLTSYANCLQKAVIC